MEPRLYNLVPRTVQYCISPTNNSVLYTVPTFWRLKMASLHEDSGVAWAAAVKASKPDSAVSATLSGWYEFQHDGGVFEVCLRPGKIIIIALKIVVFVYRATPAC